MKVTTEIVTKWAVFDEYPDSTYEYFETGFNGDPDSWKPLSLNANSIQALMQRGHVRRVIEPEQIKLVEWKYGSNRVFLPEGVCPADISILGLDPTGYVFTAEVITDGE